MRRLSLRFRVRLGALCSLVLLGLLSFVPAPAGAQGDGAATAVITGDSAAAGMPMSDRQYGIFFEDINHGADGGLYPEQVQNRSFEFNSIDNASYNGLTAWTRVNRGSAAGTIAVAAADPLNANNLNYLRMTTTAAGAGGTDGVAIRNSGFNTGVYVEAGKHYDFSFWARRSGANDLPVRVAVEDAAGTTVYASADTTITDGAWKKYTAVLTANATTTAGRLALVVGGAPAVGTTVDFDMVSLFPQDTFMGRENGMRKDLAEKIAAMHPRFLRFPGGCIANVGTFGSFPERARVYRWKDTIGPLEERPTNKNFWGYNQSYGIGFYEYFQFAEDIGATPLPVLPVGVNACGGSNRATAGELEQYVQDTLDLIQFANGSVATEWGAKRAALGHPAPFNLSYVALGNEESDPQFLENYPLFSQAIRAQYPDIKIISNSGPSSSGAVFDRNWQFAREQGADLVDEHYYNSQSWFLANAHRYDSYDRSGPHVFLGEYAARANPYDNTYYSALSEAAFMTGLERNSDVVEMASYAPLLANSSYVNWSPDAIWFDSSSSYGTPSYYVQRLFGQNTGDTVVPTTLEAITSTPHPPDIRGGIGVATWSTQAAYDDVKVTAKDGTVLFSDDFSDGAEQWSPSGPGGAPRGTWGVAGGEYRQTEDVTDARSIAGSPYWSNYTLELTARKISGAEGFLIMFGSKDSGNYYWWNLGGFNNTQSLVEKAVGGAKSSVASSTDTIVTGQTYHIKIQVDGRRIVTWLDDRKVNDFVDDSNVVEPLYQVMTRDEDTGDVVLKVVNARAKTVRTDVRLGARALADTGTVTTMATDQLTDENTFDEPTKVAPVERQVSGLGSSFTYDFPADSITFIRLHQASAAGPPGQPPAGRRRRLASTAGCGSAPPGCARIASASCR